MTKFSMCETETGGREGQFEEKTKDKKGNR